MPPKTRSFGKIVGTVVTKKVIEETVKVVVSPNHNDISAADLTDIVNQESNLAEVISSSTKQDEKVEIVSTPPHEQTPTTATTILKNIVVEDSGSKSLQKEQGNGLEEEVQKQLDREKEAAAASKDQENEVEDEDETQPAEDSQPPLLQKQPSSKSKDKDNHQQQVAPEEMNEESDVEDENGTQPAISTPPREEKTREKERTKKRKATPKSSDGEKKRKKRAKVGSGGVGITSIGYKRYIYRVLKQVHPDLGISSKAMTIINNMMNDMCERIAEESSRLSNYSGKKTLSSLDVQDGVKLVLPGELGKHAIAEGSKAVGLYVSSVLGQQSIKKPKKPKSS